MVLAETNRVGSYHLGIKEQILAKYLNSKGMLACSQIQNVNSAWNALLNDTMSLGGEVNPFYATKDEAHAGAT